MFNSPDVVYDQATVERTLLPEMILSLNVAALHLKQYFILVKVGISKKKCFPTF